MSDSFAGALLRRPLVWAGLLAVILIGAPMLALAWQTNAPAADSDTVTVSSADILRAIELPRAAQDVRAAGIDEEDLAEALRVLQAHFVGADDARDVLAAYLRLGFAARRQSLAPQVVARLDAGVPGSAIAEALRATGVLPPPATDTARLPSARARPGLVPPDSAGERRPLRDTGRIPPPGESGS